MLKKIIIGLGIIIALAIVLLVGGIFYAVSHLNSSSFADEIKTKIKNLYGLEVQFTEHQLGLTQFTLKNFRIPNPKAAAGENLLFVEEIRAKYSLPSLMDGTFLINEIILTKPAVKVRQSKEGTLILPVDLADLKTKLAAAQGTTPQVETPRSSLAFSAPDIKLLDAEIELLADDGNILFKAEKATILASFNQTSAGRDAAGTLTVKQVTVMPGLKVTDIKSPLKFEKDILSLSEITGNLYNGTLKAIVSVDTKASPITYQTKATLNSVDMSGLIADVGSDAQTLLGKLQLDFEGNGHLDAPKEILGKGTFKITEVQVPKLQKMKLLGNLIGVSALREGKFESVQGIYQIAQQKVQLNPLEIKSPNLNINMNGPVGFDKTLSLEGYVVLDPAALQLLLTLANMQPIEGKGLPVEVKGTAQEPQVRICGKLIDEILAMDPNQLINTGATILDSFLKPSTQTPSDPNASKTDASGLIKSFNPFKPKTENPQPTPTPAAP